ncbi:MAG: 1-acyl-sn-glycerol-3-phosphate acyltransferase [Anaerolineae bacterium]|jgi:1-acyl-sn-glycerol-3-phosphate acyltransferase|nr:1-acyl-sn-glycerol-3-phosphate acyltransferase [Anaerolineae bacterium]
MDIWYEVVRIILRSYLTVCVKSVEIKGAKNLPSGPKIIAANHANATDCFTLPFILKEKLHFLVQAESFTVPIIGRLLALADQIPVVQRRGYEALNIAKDRLAQGHTVVIFPEGKLNHGQNFHRPRIGAVLLSILSGTPIIPIGFYVPSENTHFFQSHFHNRKSLARWQIRGKCFIRIGKPYTLKGYSGAEADYRALRELTQELMEKISELIDQATEAAHSPIDYQLPDLNLEAS